MSAPVAALARKVFEEYSRAGGNPPDAHFDRNAAEQWMAHALEFAGVAKLIYALEAMVEAGEFSDWDNRCSAQDNARTVLASVKGGAQ